jgi:hypothetical protein
MAVLISASGPEAGAVPRREQRAGVECEQYFDGGRERNGKSIAMSLVGAGSENRI